MAPGRGRGGARPLTPRHRAGPRRRLRFGPQGKSSGKTLPKIEEGVVAKVGPSSPESCQGKVPEAADLEKKEEKIEESTKPQQESLINFFEIQDRLQDTEATSSSDVTLPTGVSTYVLQCLDSIIDHSTDVTDSLSSCPSPETFRDDVEVSDVCAENSGKYKNSTFLDPSKAVSIDRMPQVLNVSAIPETVLEDFQVRYPGRKRASKSSYSSSQLSAPPTLAGIKVHKITTARERSPDLKAGMRCPSPLGPKRKPDNQTAKPEGSKRKKKVKHLEEGQSSFSPVPGAPGSSLVESAGMAAEMPSFRQRGALEQVSPTKPVEEENKALKAPGSTRLSKLEPLCSRFPICSIVRTSPKWKSSVIQIPVRSKAPCLPKGLPEGNGIQNSFTVRTGTGCLSV
ncbi:uncharacterized protein LOC128853624 [Cuculus canorus]|uniref:uncharacterized protein LOC128853624 n=1 Tax=Cuculus canorus TaxID=55661 RepID=UPI0023AA2592|nr:uncharacterized protein LOC128853624 [Cuculus canorus]